MRWLVAVLLLALVACGSAPTEVATEETAKDQARRQVAEAEAFAQDAQRQIDAAEAAVAEAERIVKEQQAQAEAEARHAAAARASRSRTTAPTAPQVTATPTPSGSIQEAICNAFGRACAWALRVARCESRFNPRATNGQFRGLFQIGARIHAARIARMGFTPDQMWEVGPNIAVALAIYNEQGGRPWQCK